MSVRLYVKLPKAELEKESLEKMFSEFEPSFTTKIIKERKKNECRGFGFVTVPTDEDAELFISKYNQQVLVYNDQAFKDENGEDFVLLIEKALPRTKGEKGEGEEGEATTADSANPDETQASSSGDASDASNVSIENNKPRRNNNNNSGAKKGKKPRKTATPKAKTDKPVAVTESIQPDPRWASQLSKLKEMFAAQTK